MPEDRANRIRLILDKKGLTANALSTKCGIGSSNFKRMLSGDLSITDKTLHKIHESFPDINIEWLKTGKGEMLSQYIPKTYPTDINETDEYEEEDYVRLLPIEAMAGSLSCFSEGVSLRDCRKIKAPVDGADFAIHISGDSMEPELHNGSYLYIRKMTGSFIPWGNAVVIDTYDGVVVKKIFPGDNGDEEYVWAKSVNPNYPPFKIAVSEIIGIYRILGWSCIVSTM